VSASSSLAEVLDRALRVFDATLDVIRETAGLNEEYSPGGIQPIRLEFLK
jgi:hypothetical protein